MESEKTRILFGASLIALAALIFAGIPGGLDSATANAEDIKGQFLSASPDTKSEASIQSTSQTGKKGLTSYWRFDNPEVSGGYSLKFDGEDDYINASSSSIRFYDYNFTISAWIKPESIDGEFHDNVSGVFLGQDYGSSVALGLDETGHIFLNMDDTRTGTPVSSQELIENRWYHVAVTYTRPSNETVYYVNGQRGSGSPHYIYDGNGIETSTEFWIGRSQRYSMYFEGGIDGVRVYNKSLSGEEIDKLYQGVTPEKDNLVLGYNFESGPECDLTGGNTCIHDSSGENAGLPRNFDDNVFGTESGWINGTPVNVPSLKDYSPGFDVGNIHDLETAELVKGSVDGLEGGYNLLENPGFEDTSLGTGVNVNASGWDMDHQDLYLNGDSIFDLQSSKATEGSYGYGEESCCDPYDDGSGNGGTGSGYIAQRENMEGGQEIHASIKANVLVRGLSNVGTCSGSDVYVGEDDSRLRFVAYNSTGHQIGSKWGHWGTWFVYQAGNTSGDYHGWTELGLNWTTPADTEQVEMRVYYGDATDSCQPWTWWDGGNGAVFWDEASLVRKKSLKWVKGPSGDHALKFDKEDDLIKGIDNSDLVREYNKDREITINLWFKIDKIYTDSNWNDIIQFGDTTNGTNTGGDGVRLERLSNTNDTLAFYTYNEGGNHQWNLGTAGPYTLDKWHMATLVMDYPEASESRVYLDGSLSNTQGQPDTWNMSHGTLEIFSQGDWADFAIDDFRIYSRELSEKEIKALYNGKNIRKGLVDRYSFESGDRSKAYETSGLDRSGILGTDSLLLREAKISGLSTASRDFTFSTWIKPRRDGHSAILSERKQNQAKYSEIFSNNVWEAYCNTGTWDYNTTELEAPDGTYTAAKFQTLDSGSGCDIMVGKIQSIPTEKRTYTVSIWAKSKESGKTFDLGTTDSEECRFSLTDEWKRYTCQRKVSDTSRGLQFYGADSNSTYYVWGAQRQFGEGAGNYVETKGQRIQEAGLSSWIKGGKIFLKSGNSTHSRTSSEPITYGRWHRMAV
ncbi:MAG: LamG-like jellyroll fold domain-containing protein, partial [Candidatus Nanohalobium sp.]